MENMQVFKNQKQEIGLGCSIVFNPHAHWCYLHLQCHGLQNEDDKPRFRWSRWPLMLKQRPRLKRRLPVVRVDIHQTRWSIKKSITWRRSHKFDRLTNLICLTMKKTSSISYQGNNKKSSFVLSLLLRFQSKRMDDQRCSLADSEPAPDPATRGDNIH